MDEAQRMSRTRYDRSTVSKNDRVKTDRSDGCSQRFLGYVVVYVIDSADGSGYSTKGVVYREDGSSSTTKAMTTLGIHFSSTSILSK